MNEIISSITWAIGELKKRKLISGYKEIDIDLCLGNDGIYNILKERVKEFNLKELSQYIYRKDPEVCERMWQYISGHNNLSLKSENIPEYIPDKVKILIKMIQSNNEQILNISKEMWSRRDEPDK